ncbi:putative Aminopeptidase M1 [Trypanosoma cruzi]|uniref:Aminopeptidase n=1 Tax=Trypanosoma cruzi TaxID=5693 RepID=A0A2V2XDC4_TRYCR|nr:putative Aminopeptidase M1 [Trypanosoma cruzi]
MSSVTNSVKLHNPFVPSSYDLHVSVDLANWRYEGKEKVVLRRSPGVEVSREVQLHCGNSVNIQCVTGAAIAGRDEKAGTLLLLLDGEPADGHTVTFAFSHEIREEMRGLYRAVFKTSDGAEHRMAATHFEPTAARLFYICQDEPSARADFTLHVSLPSSMAGFTVLSNGPLKSKETQGDTVTHHFETIPAVPPYLTSCFVGELEFVGTTACGIPVKVYTTVGKSYKAAFALKTTAFALEYFEKFFKCKYPLPKLDVVAVPDFPIGGMENWGCIACVESILLEEQTSSVESLKRAASLICHEVSHNWFGNLVTINWWEGLWLKEGFASWCGYDAAHHLEPSWKLNEDAAMEVTGALVTDMYEHSHPVEVPIHDPAEITQIFDDISYSKGMGLVFMLQAFLGEKWAASVAHYIQKHQYSDTRTIQLWQALEESSGVQITEAMQSFTTQMGYPIIHVSRPTPSTVVLRQEPCQFLTAVKRNTTLWCVPIVLQGVGGATHRVILRGSEPQQVELPHEVAKSPWINANPSGRGFFRCRYDNEMFSSLMGAYSSLTIPDRRGLIADTLASIYMGNEDFDRMALFPSLLGKLESDKIVWQEYYKSMENILAILEDDAEGNELRRKLMHSIDEKATKLLNTEPNTMEERLERALYINAAISTALKLMPLEVALQCPSVKWAIKQAECYMEGGTPSLDTLAMSLSAYVRLGPNAAAARTDALWERYTRVHDSDELCRCILRALCWAEDPCYVENTAKKCIYNEGIRAQYGGVIFLGVVSNPSMPKGYAWSLFKKHFQGVEKQWGSGTFRIQNIVESVARSLTGETQAKEFHEFFQTHPLPHARLAIQRAVEDIQLRTWLRSKWGVGTRLSSIFFPH